MFTTFALPAVHLEMSSRRRAEDMGLYDFAKKYQENQSSSELVKKQNASEDKVLSARLEYLNNQEVLTMKTLEKEIDLIKRRKMYGWDGSRKNSVSSHHFDRASLPNTPRRWTKHNFSPAKFVKRDSLPQPEPQPVSRKQKHRETTRNVRSNENIYKRKTPPSIEHKEHEETSANDPHVVNVMQADVNTDIATLPIKTPANDHQIVIQESLNTSTVTLQTEKQAISDSSGKIDEIKSFPNPTFKNKGRFSNNATLRKDKTKTPAFPSWSRYSHKKQNLSKTQDTKHEVPESEQSVNGSSVNLNLRQIPSRFHHSDTIKLKLNDSKLNSLLDLGGGMKDLRFKNLESVLIPH
jgi:hypothetical protein